MCRDDAMAAVVYCVVCPLLLLDSVAWIFHQQPSGGELQADGGTGRTLAWSLQPSDRDIPQFNHLLDLSRWRNGETNFTLVHFFSFQAYRKSVSFLFLLGREFPQNKLPEKKYMALENR
jgi:hypothetical protein